MNFGQPQMQQNKGAPASTMAVQGAGEGQSAAAQNTVFAIDTQHEANINDCQFDYYGTQVASVGSEGCLQISSVRDDLGQQQQNPGSTFKAHEGPIWQVAWAHPKYESVVATCGYDGFVNVWKRDVNRPCAHLVFQENLESSVNCIAWAPWEYGLILAAGTAEGRLVIFVRTPEDQWVKSHDFIAHQSDAQPLDNQVRDNRLVIGQHGRLGRLDAM